MPSIDKPIQNAELALSSLQDIDKEIANFYPEIQIVEVQSSGISAPDAPTINGRTYVNAVETFRQSIKRYCLSTFDFATSVKRLDAGFAGRKSPIKKWVGAEEEIKELNIFRDLNCETAPTFNTTNLKIDDVRASINILRMQIISRPFGDPLSIDVLDGARSIRATLSQFVLPLMYGLLGAIASVVRSLSESVSNVPFSRIDRVLYLMRVPLGALAGATVGLVFEAQTLSSLEGLTSLGIAFAAGYTVEIFFSALDGLITRLSASPQPAQ